MEEKRCPCCNQVIDEYKGSKNHNLDYSAIEDLNSAVVSAIVDVQNEGKISEQTFRELKAAHFRAHPNAQG